MERLKRQQRQATIARKIFESQEKAEDKLKLCMDYPKGVREAFDRLLKSNWGSLSAEMQRTFGVDVSSPFNVDVSQRAFCAQFHGDGPKKLYAALDALHRNEQFARVAGLFQSSGWGKSRLVKELHGQGVWVVYLSLGTGSCYPERAKFADEFESTLRQLMGCGDLAGQVQCMNYCLAFWISCIQALAHLAPTTSPEKFAEMMTCSRGGDFWPTVQELMKGNLSSATLPSPAQVWDRLEFLQRWDDAASSVYNNLTAHALKSLGVKQPLKLLFVIDEARHLLPYQGRREASAAMNYSPRYTYTENVYVPLSRSTRALNRSLVLFIDTISVTNFLSPEWKERSWKDPSARVQKPTSGFFLPPPFVGFFQANLGMKHDTGADKTFLDVVDEHAMVRFGRPLWWSIYQASLDKTGDREGAFSAVKSLAMVKLTGCGTPHQVQSDEERIAIVGNRCALDVNPSSQLAADLVAGHAMTVHHVSADRSRVYGAWPVEPLLSEVAYDAMRGIKLDETKGYRFLLEPVQRQLSAGLLDVGELRESILRIILLEAIDNVRARENRAWITVRELLGELFGDKTAQDVIESVAAYQKVKLEKLLTGKVLVNSFQRVYKRSCDMTLADAKVAMEARCAIVASSSQGTCGLEFVIFAHLGAEDAPLNPTMIQIQTKVTDDASGLIPLAKLSPQYSGISFLEPGVPYMSLFVNLKLGGKGKIELVQPHLVWKSVANSEDKVIRAAREVLEADGTMEKLRKNLEIAGATKEKEGLPSVEEVAAVSSSEENDDAFSQAKREEITAATAGKRKRNEDEELTAEAETSKKKGKAVHERWQNWIKADWSDRIILKARSLNSFNLDANLKKCLENMSQLQVKMHGVKPSTLSVLEESRYNLMERNWELQRDMLDSMFAFKNIALRATLLIVMKKLERGLLPPSPRYKRGDPSEDSTALIESKTVRLQASLRGRRLIKHK